MPITFDSRVDSKNADDSFESDGARPSQLTTSSPFQGEYDTNAQSSLCSNIPDTTKESFKSHGADKNVEIQFYSEHGADEVSGRGSSFNQTDPRRCGKLDGSAPREGSFAVPPLAGMASLLPYSQEALSFETLAALTPAVPGAAKEASFPLITSNDYSDRQRLLYHITYLHTQLQRAFLQIQEQQRILTILQASASANVERPHQSIADTSIKSVGSSNPTEHPKKGVTDDVVVLRIAASCTAAAVAASRTEEALHAALHESLALFDPVIAESEIQRLNDALSHISILREAELQQLQRGEEELKELRKARNDLVERVDILQSSCEKLAAKNEELDTSLSSASLEVERLRREELRLSRRIGAMEGLLQTGNLYDGVRVMDGKVGQHQLSQLRGAGTNGGLGSERTTNRQDVGVSIEKLWALSEEEAIARQTLLQDFFWEPMLIAFDAGLTWTEEFLALTEERNALALEKVSLRDPGSNALIGVAAATQTEDNAALSGLSAAVRVPALDADLLLLRSQQDEIQQLQRQVEMLKERQRLTNLEVERLSGLYANEQRRSEDLAKDHSVQLQRAYEELVKDRQLITQQLCEEVKEQVRIAFQDGRQYERQHQGPIPLTEPGSSSDCLRNAEKAQGSRHLVGKPPPMRS